MKVVSAFLVLMVAGSVLAQDGVGGEGVEAESSGVWVGVWVGLAVVSLLAGWKTGWFKAPSYRDRRDAGLLSWTGWLAIAVVIFFLQAFFGSAGLALWQADDRLMQGSLATIFGAFGAVVAGIAAVRVVPDLKFGRPAGLVVVGRDVWCGALVCLGAIPLVTVAGYAGLAGAEALGLKVDQLSHETLRLLNENQSVAALLVTMFAVVVAAPVAEELIFRGFIQTGLSELGLGPVWATFAGSLAFLTVHITVLDASSMPALFVLSVVLGLSFEKTGRLGTPIVAHACFNAFNLWASGV